MRIDDFFVCLFLFCFVLMFARKIFCGFEKTKTYAENKSCQLSVQAAERNLKIVSSLP